MSIHRERFQVPEGYPDGTQGQLARNQMFDDLTKAHQQNLYSACVRNTNSHAKPKSSDSKSDLIYKRVFTDLLWLVHAL